MDQKITDKKESTLNVPKQWLNSPTRDPLILAYQKEREKGIELHFCSYFDFALGTHW